MPRAALFIIPTLFITSIGHAQWVEFVDVTDSALVLDDLYKTNDNMEKDFEWGDFDKDGDVDLVVVRKFPGSIEGGAKNLLLLNENGVLIDYTDSFATASQPASDGGFFALTNDRDVKAADVDQDGWLDLVTCTTMSDDISSMLGQPRVYRNLGNNQAGEWLGFQFENIRIPVLKAANGSDANPRACALDVEDLTGDGYPDIFFVDYDTPETSGTVCIDLNLDGDTNDIVDGVSECNQSPGEDSNNDFQGKLLINQGAANPGFFVDSTTTRMTGSQLEMAFGNEVHIYDVNNDGHKDIIRVNTLTTGQDVAVYYNNPASPGANFIGPETVTGNAPYGMNIGDLNNDGLIDIVIADDGQDAYMINNGVGSNGIADWTRYVIEDSLSEFGNGIQIADLDNDGWLDVMMCDVDADLGPFCPSSGRRMHIYHNTQNVEALLDEDGLILPSWALDSTYDVAPIDLNGDGWKDLVVGACYGISVFYNNPPIGIGFDYPNGRPELMDPATTTEVDITLTPIGGTIEAGSALLWSSIDGGPFSSTSLDGTGPNFVASLPSLECDQSLNWYVSADLESGATYRDPIGSSNLTLVATGFEVAFTDDMENGAGDWTTEVDPSVTNGQWELVEPIGTTTGGIIYAPLEDASDAGTFCWVTAQGEVGGTATSSDLDGGPVRLYSPSFDLSLGAGRVTFQAWFKCNDLGNTAQEDKLTVEISNGGAWIRVMQISGIESDWTEYAFDTDTFVANSSTVQIRFSCSDEPNDSLTEAAIDDLSIEILACESDGCLGDLDNDGFIDGADMGLLLSGWATPETDLDGNGTTDGGDLGLLLSLFNTDC